jgi:hypothetical protein
VDVDDIRERDVAESIRYHDASTAVIRWSLPIRRLDNKQLCVIMPRIHDDDVMRCPWE